MYTYVEHGVSVRHCSHIPVCNGTPRCCKGCRISFRCCCNCFCLVVGQLPPDFESTGRRDFQSQNNDPQLVVHIHTRSACVNLEQHFYNKSKVNQLLSGMIDIVVFVVGNQQSTRVIRKTPEQIADCPTWAQADGIKGGRRIRICFPSKGRENVYEEITFIWQDEYPNVTMACRLVSRHKLLNRLMVNLRSDLLNAFELRRRKESNALCVGVIMS